MKNSPNMSYCQFQNTALGMDQVIETLESHLEVSGDEYDDTLSEDELRAAAQLFSKCQAYVERMQQVVACHGDFGRDEDDVEERDVRDFLKARNEEVENRGEE